MDQYRNFIALSRYAKWLDGVNRRETWAETVDRYFNFFVDTGKIEDSATITLRDAVKNHEVMPSMRALMTAGAALARDNVAGYNCCYTTMSGDGEPLTLTHEKLDAPITVFATDPVCFDELMYILMCGTGVGFSAERQYVNQLPKVGKRLNRSRYLATEQNYPKVDLKEISVFDENSNTVVVEDSKYGWASALRIVLFELYNGNFSISWDVSKIRPAGQKLKTFGGRASGPKPLVDLFDFVRTMFSGANGRKLSSLEVHDITCKIADVVVVGGVRRSALLGLSNPSDDRIRKSKTGSWWVENPQRALANNSACYTEKPDFSSFLSEWQSLYESKSGERGMVSRVALQKKAQENGRRDHTREFGLNPCAEIILRPQEFCNLSECVVRSSDNLLSLSDKVAKATILGTLQATLTDFCYLRPIWEENTREEALLGVSLTGIMDNKVMAGTGDTSDIARFVGDKHELTDLEGILSYLRQVAVDTNKVWAEKLGINQAAAITCVKPSGTVSQLVDSASGIHPRFSPYYIRTVRADKKDPLAKFMTEAGFPVEPCFMKPETTQVFSFPQKAPEGSVCVSDVGAIEQLRVWKIYQDHWCEHKPSITVYYKDNEFLSVGQWLYNNFDDVSGVSFLPFSEHTYQQAPYQEVDKETYESWLDKMPKDVDWSGLGKWEKEDGTKGTKELACSAGVCELVDL